MRRKKKIAQAAEATAEATGEAKTEETTETSTTTATDLEGRHVEVVDEEEHLFAGGWTEQGLALLLEFGLEHVLEVRGLRLRRVLHGVGHELVCVGRVLEVLLHDDTLPDPGVPHIEDVVPPTG